jgi:hypothetical protein
MSMPLSLVDTEYSIWQVQHTLSTAYNEYSIHWVQHPLKNVCVPVDLIITNQPHTRASASSVSHCTIKRRQLPPPENSMVKTSCHIPTFVSQLADELIISTWHAVHRLFPRSYSIALDHRLQRLITQTRSIQASQFA